MEDARASLAQLFLCRQARKGRPPWCGKDLATALLRELAQSNAGDGLRNAALDLAWHTLEKANPNPGHPGYGFRNQVIMAAIDWVCSQYQIAPTRRSNYADSGCAIVAEALQTLDLIEEFFPEGDLKEASIETVWRRFRRSKNRPI